MKITVRYSSIDHFSKSRTFKSLAGAQNYARYWVGKTPELGTSYAVSSDGVGKVTVSGCTLTELFPALAAPKSVDDYRIEELWDGEEPLYRVFFGARLLGAYDTHREAAEHVAMAREHDAENWSDDGCRPAEWSGFDANEPDDTCPF